MSQVLSLRIRYKLPKLPTLQTLTRLLPTLLLLSCAHPHYNAETASHRCTIREDDCRRQISQAKAFDLKYPKQAPHKPVRECTKGSSVVKLDTSQPDGIRECTPQRKYLGGFRFSADAAETYGVVNPDAAPETNMTSADFEF